TSPGSPHDCGSRASSPTSGPRTVCGSGWRRCPRPSPRSSSVCRPCGLSCADRVPGLVRCVGRRAGTSSDAVADYDLIVIGSGSGNSLVTPDFPDRKVAVIERGIFGGTCLNVGCIPTKMFVYAADVATTIREASRYGIDATLDGVRWRGIRDRIFDRIDPISE